MDDPGTIWTQGYSLSKALEKLGDADQGRRYAELRAEPALAIMEDIAGMMVKYSDRGEQIDRASQMTSEWDEVRHSLRDEIRTKLRDGALVGVGYRMPRGKQDFPELIPAEVWEGSIDWDASEVRGGGERFALVRVVPADDVGGDNA